MDNPNTEQRKPLLSDAEVSAMDDRQSSNYYAGEAPSYTTGIEDARDFYEAKITSGELMVSKTVKRPLCIAFTRPGWHNDPEKRKTAPPVHVFVTKCCRTELHMDLASAFLNDWNCCPICATMLVD